MIEIGRYTRDIPVSLERMFENALDWEHLPHLHRTTLTDASLRDRAGNFWEAKLRFTGMAAASQTVRLTLDESTGVWISEVIGGVSLGLAIHTTATAHGPESLTVDVRFLVPGRRPWNRLLGRRLVAGYSQLYDEDESMMITRQARLNTQRGAGTHTASMPVALGSRSVVLEPGFTFNVGLRRFRVAEVIGSLVAFSVVCPHMLGPLEDSPVVEGTVTCPWHGYQFDITTRRGGDRRHQLRPAPHLRLDDHGVVWAESNDSDRNCPN